MAVRSVLMVAALSWPSCALAQLIPLGEAMHLRSNAPELELGRNNFSLPVVEYRAPDGTIKVSQGIIIGRDISPNATIGLGLFKMKPKFDEDSGLPTGGKSRKAAIGLSLRF